MEHLRSERKIRLSRHGSPLNRDGRGQIVDPVSIRERPAEIEDRAAPGHWEGDTVVGSNNSSIATLVERTTRFVMLTKVENGRPKRWCQPSSRPYAGSLETYESRLAGTEDLNWPSTRSCPARPISKSTFAIRTHLGNAGPTRNTNGLLRQYFPRRMDLASITPAQLHEVARQLNGRPRETLSWKTPAYRLAEVFR
jgi:IS30 family transposase